VFSRLDICAATYICVTPSIHSGLTRGALPMIWPQFDPAGFSQVEQCMVRFAEHIYCESFLLYICTVSDKFAASSDCRARALSPLNERQCSALPEPNVSDVSSTLLVEPPTPSFDIDPTLVEPDLDLGDAQDNLSMSSSVAPPPPISSLPPAPSLTPEIQTSATPEAEASTPPPAVPPACVFSPPLAGITFDLSGCSARSEADYNFVLKNLEWGIEWTRCLQQFVGFERASGFPVSRRSPPVCAWR
jgi:hypothetical protein